MFPSLNLFLNNDGNNNNATNGNDNHNSDMNDISIIGNPRSFNLIDSLDNLQTCENFSFEDNLSEYQ